MAVEPAANQFSPENVISDFADANQFTEEDLETNRDNKRTFLPRFLQTLIFGKAAGGIVMLLGCLWALIVGFLQSSKLTFLLLLDVLGGRTACAEGRVASCKTEEDAQGLDKFHGETKWSYQYVIKDLELEVTEEGFDLLHTKYDNMRPKVKIYYTPKSKMLLSIEPA
jgi:hypothetical protein